MNPPNYMKSVALIALSLAIAVQGVLAQGFSKQPWTGDSSVTESSSSVVWAYNFGSSTSASINGVTFTGILGSNPSVSGKFSLTASNQTTGDSNSLTSLGGGSAIMASTFVYNPGVNLATLTLSGLTAGKVYSLNCYTVGWGDGVRQATWSSGSDSGTFGVDDYGNNNGLRLNYTFTASATTRSISINSLDTGRTWHFYGLALSTVDPIIALSGSGNTISNGGAAATGNGTDFGSATVTGGTVVRTFTITNSGAGALNLTGTPPDYVTIGGTNAADFTVTAQPTTPVAAGGGTTTFQVTFDPSALGLRTATLSIANNDSVANPFHFNIQGTGISADLANLELKSGSTTHTLAPAFASGITSYTLDLPNQMFAVKIRVTPVDSAALMELSVNNGFFTTLTPGFFTGDVSLNVGSNTIALRVTAPDTVTTKTYTVTINRAPLSPLVLGDAGSSGGGTGGGTISAPNADATGSLGKWESVREGAVMSNSGALAFRGHLELGTGTPPVTVNDFQGIWKYDTVDTRLKARSGSVAPETGNALFDMLPLNPVISPSGFISFYGTLRMGTGSPAVSASYNAGLWSELGGSGLRLVIRKGDNIPGASSFKTFRNGFTVASSSSNTLALNTRLSNGSALLHLDLNAPATVVTLVAEEGQAAPGGGTWAALDGNSSDPRLSVSGDLGFIGWELVGSDHIQGIYSRPASTPAGTVGVSLEARAGSTAPGTSGATFSAFERPTLFNGGMAFRGFLNQNGDNSAGTKGQGIWYGDFGALAPVIRTGDGNAEVNTIPAGSTVTSLWSPFSNAQSTIAYRVGLSNGVTETRAIMYTSTLQTDVVAKVGDAAPGLPGETFTNFDHPVIGDRDQIAFTASTNAGTYGLWRRGLESGAIRLVLKVGDSINTSEGFKTISGISVPGTSTDDRKFESVCIDDNGNILVHITFGDGTTSLLLGQ